MNMYSPKHVLLPGLFLAFALSCAQAQLTNLYFITGPEMLCAGQCDSFILAASQPGSGETLTNVQWSISSGVSAPGNPVLLCFEEPGIYDIIASGTTANGQNIQSQPYSIWVDACSGPIEILSNAALICATNNILPPPPPPPPNGFALLISDVSGAVAGQTICMDVTTQNFTNILGMQFSINYNPSQLQLISVSNFGLPGLSAGGNFGLPLPGNAGITPPGIITTTWTPSDQTGQTLPNGSTLFTLCFTVLSGGCSTDVVFSNIVTPIEIYTALGQIVPFFSRPGRVSLVGGGNPDLPSCCEKVCEGATVQYRLTSPSATAPATWTVQGAQSYTVNDNGYGVEVIWGSSGQGFVSALAGNSVARLCVNILAIPEASFSSSPPANNDTLRVCRGQSVSFVNTSQGAETSLWQFGDGNSSTEISPEYAWADPGTYRVALLTYNECLCADTAFVHIIVAPALAPQITCRGTVCEGTAVRYTTDADCGTFLWTTSPNGTVTTGGGPTDNFITIDWHSGPEGFIQLQVENCANTAYCLEPNLMPVPILSESAQITGPVQVCRSQLARYSITRFGGTEFNWSASSLGSIQAGQGTYEVAIQWAGTLSAQPQWVAVEYYNCYLGCGGRDTIWVNIRPDFFVTGSVESCLNTPQNYTSRRTDNNLNVLCTWEVLTSDDTVVWTSGTATATPSVPWDFGTGRFRLIARPTIPAEYCSPATQISVKVLDSPPALSSIAGAAVICPGLAYTYTAIGTQPGHRVNWTTAGGTGASTATGNPLNVTWSLIPPYAIAAQQVSPQGCVSAPHTLDVVALSAFSIRSSI